MKSALRTVIFLVICLSPFHAAAEGGHPNEGRDYSKFYNGSFWEISARGGLTRSDLDEADGWSGDIGFRQALPMLLLDTRISYRHDRLENDDGLELRNHRVGLHGGLHPFYFFILGSDWFAYVLSSLYLELGVALQSAEMMTDQRYDDFEVVWSVGAGLDIPITDPDVGYAPWINVVYRYSASGFDLDDMNLDTDQHTIFVGLGWRVNGLLF